VTPVAQYPLVSIVTPSYNTARFLEAAIASVLAQDYPRIDYIVADGGSTDGTLEILEKCAARLRYFSRPDAGPADAVNRAFREAPGTILAILPADDLLAPGAVSSAVAALREHPGAAAVYGEACWMDEQGRPLGPYPTRPFDRDLLARECFISMPACFFRREALESIGPLDDSFRLGWDHDLWIRMSRRHELRKIDVPMASVRMHARTKTLGERRQVFEEGMRVLRKHYGYIPFSWVHGYCCYRIDGRDQFFEPLRPSVLKYLVSLPAGLWLNRRHPIRYGREWASVMTRAALERRWRARRRGASPETPISPR